MPGSRAGNKVYNITDESLLELLKALASCDLKITIVGAMLINVILDGAQTPLKRGTHDVDVNIEPDLLLEAISTDSTALRDVIASKLSSAGYSYAFEVKRDLTPGESSLGLHVLSRTGEEIIAKMDVNIIENTYRVRYDTVHGFSFYGQSMAKIFSDKVNGASKRNVLWRYKDLYDLSLLYNYQGWSTKITSDIWSNSGNEPGDFATLLGRVDDLRHAHETVASKHLRTSTDFDTVYFKARQLIEPFRKPQSEELIWDGSKWVRRSQYRGTLMLKTENFARQSSGFGTLHLQ